MSTNVDERVVKMEFDDSGFSSGADRAIGTLDRLKSSLNFKSAESGFSNLQKAANGFNLSTISDNIGTVSSHFSAFESFVAGIFLRLGSRAADFGANLVKKMTFGSMTSGFDEYELQMRSIQTILSNTGDKLKAQGFETQEEQIGVINERLDELNEYADKTIYNFSQMTRNIGLFTAAGVDLDTATSAIQGISNLAAASGADNAAAGRAMYNLSQAISTGTVRLIDWNSVVNAGMGGELFQNALKRTARAHGVAVDAIIAKNGSFRDSLQEGWLTADILTDTLGQLTIQIGDVGYETREAGIETLKAQGYTEDEANAILDLAENAYEAATKVRTWKQLWETVGESLGSGWAQSWRIIVGDFLGATEVFTWFSDRITGMVNESADARNALLQTWADRGGRSALFGGLQNLFIAAEQVFGAISGSFDAVFGITAEDLVEITEKFASFTESLVLSDEQANYLAGTFDILFSIFRGAGSVIMDVVSYFATLASEIGKALSGLDAFRRIALIVENFADAIFVPLDAIGSAFAEVFSLDGLGSTLSGPLDSVLKFLARFSDSLILSEDSAKTLHDTFKGFFEFIKNGFDSSVFSDILSFFSGIVENVKNSGVIDSIKEFFSSIDLKKLGNGAYLTLFGGAILKIVGIIKGFLDDKKGGGIKETIFGVFDELKETLSSFTESIKAGSLVAIAFAVGILAGSLIALSTIPADKLMSSVLMMGAAFGELIGAFALFSKISDGKRPKGALSLVLMAVAVNVLSSAMQKLSSLEWEGIGKGFAAIAALLGALMLAVNNMPDSGKILSSAAAMLLMSFAIGVLALSMKLLATIKAEDIAKGLSAIGGLLLGFMIALNNMPDSGRILSSAAAMLIMSLAIGALALSMKLFATMSWDDIGRALTSVGGLLLGFMIALNNMPDSGRILSSAAAMLIMSLAIGALALSMKLISTINWEDIGKGLLTIAGLLIGVGIALSVFQANIGGALAMAAVAVSVLLLAAAVNVLVPAIQALSQLSVGEVATALLAIGGALAILGGVSMLLAPAALPLLGVGAAMLMLGGAALLLANAIAILAGVFGPIMPMLLEAGGNIVNGIVQGIGDAVTGVVEAASTVGTAFLDGVKSFFGIHSPSTVMNEVGGNVVQGLIDGLGENSEALGIKADELSSMITDATSSLPTDMSIIGTDAVGGLSSALDNSTLPSDFSMLGSDAVTNLSSALSAGKSTVSGNIDGIVSGASKSAKGLGSNLKTQASVAMTSFRSGIQSGANGIQSDFAAIVKSASSAVAPLGNKLKSEATKAMNGFSSAIKAGSGAAKNAVNSVMNAASSSVKSMYSKFYDVGRNAVQGLINGIDSLLGRARSKADELTKVVVKVVKAGLQVKSPSRVFMGIGQNVVQGLINGMDNLLGDAATAGSDLSGTVVDSFGNSLNGMAIGMDDLLDTDYNPVITPVINSAEFDSNLQQLSAMMNSRLSDSMNIGSVNYNETFAGKLDAVADINKQAMQQFAESAIDYDLLGLSVANALIRSGVHVEMDGGQLMGYLAGEIRDVRRMSR